MSDGAPKIAATELFTILPDSELAPGGSQQVGNKAWNLMRMARAGLPIPPAFVLPTDWCGRADAARTLPVVLTRGILALETATRLVFGGSRLPLLVSVRSGAAVSMPGMMETVLDVGLNAETVEALIRQTGNPRLAWDCYRRLIQGYADVVAGLPTAPFDALIAVAMATAGAESERDLDHRDLRTLTRAMLACYREQTGQSFPSDPAEQLLAATLAVLRSWSADKAVSYRRLNGIDDTVGTAVTVQTMVFGNAGGASGAGVGFTRNPATGIHELYFDFQFDGQGEDVVAGRQRLMDHDRLRLALPLVWTRLNEICATLETLFGDAQDFEFTVQSREIFLLQARRAKRTDWAALVIAVDMVADGILTSDQALAQIADVDLGSVVRTRFAAPMPPSLATALVASLGVATGAIALDPAAVLRLAASGTPAILVRHDTVTSDIEGMAQALGMLTASGGRTSHAAVVARQLGKVCLVACPGLEIDMERRQCRIGGTLLDEGDMLALDGNTGAVYAGHLTTLEERPSKALAAIAGWRSAAGLSSSV